MNICAYFFITGSLFAIIMLIHVLRLINHWAITIGDWNVPLWISWAGFSIFGGLWLWTLLLIKNRTGPV